MGWLEIGGARMQLIGPDGPGPLDELAPDERKLIELYRALPPEHRASITRLAMALPGHDVAREGVLLALSLLERQGLMHTKPAEAPISGEATGS